MKRFVEFLKVVGIVVGSLLAAWGLWDKVATLWQDKLVAEVHFGAWRLPPQYASRVTSLQLAMSDSALVENGGEKSAKAREFDVYNTRKAIIRPAQDAVRGEIEYGLSQNPRNIAGNWDVTVRNASSHRVSHVTLALPDAKIATIGRDGFTLGDTTVASVILIGDLQPREEVSVFAWNARIPGRWDLKDVRVTHDAGVGTVKSFVPVGRFGQMAETIAGFPIVVICLWILSTMLVVILRVWSPPPSRGTSESTIHSETRKDAA